MSLQVREIMLNGKHLEKMSVTTDFLNVVSVKKALINKKETIKRLSGLNGYDFYISVNDIAEKCEMTQSYIHRLIEREFKIFKDNEIVDLINEPVFDEFSYDDLVDIDANYAKSTTYFEKDDKDKVECSYFVNTLGCCKLLSLLDSKDKVINDVIETARINLEIYDNVITE